MCFSFHRLPNKLFFRVIYISLPCAPLRISITLVGFLFEFSPFVCMSVRLNAVVNARNPHKIVELEWHWEMNATIVYAPAAVAFFWHELWRMTSLHADECLFALLYSSRVFFSWMDLCCFQNSHFIREIFDCLLVENVERPHNFVVFRSAAVMWGICRKTFTNSFEFILRWQFFTSTRGFRGDGKKIKETQQINSSTCQPFEVYRNFWCIDIGGNVPVLLPRKTFRKRGNW